MNKAIHTLICVCAISLCLAEMCVSEVRSPAGTNLLQNPGFEEGTSSPDGWEGLPEGASGVTFEWTSDMANTGTYCVAVDVQDGDLGYWQQVVQVVPETVYTFTGWVAFEHAEQSALCNLEVVFRASDGALLKTVDLPSHNGSRAFSYDFPPELKVRSPENAAVAEINLLQRGSGTAYFDDIHFGLSPKGTIAGHVTSEGAPLEGVRLLIWGKPWEKEYEATSDASGEYTIPDLPDAAPRYILIASKPGYKTSVAGRIDVLPDSELTVDFELEPGKDAKDPNLRVKFANIGLQYATDSTAIPPGSVIPADPTGYPTSLRPYLESDECITSDHPHIVGLASSILSSLPEASRSDTYSVSWAAYEWICYNIDHDSVYSAHENGLDNPFADITSGIWQTIGDNGWCYGLDYYDWCLRPQELLQVGSGICIEQAWLGTALLRALNIPARPSVGSLEFWAQTDSANGCWVYMSPNAGRVAFRERGQLGPGFEGSARLPRHSVTSLPMMAEDWDCRRRGLWREHHPWSERYVGTQEGYEKAQADLGEFARTGSAVSGDHHGEPGDVYGVYYSDITVNLFNIGGQRHLTARFPFVTESEVHHSTGDRAYWTDHPECVVDTFIEEITNPPAEGVERWFNIEFDLAPLFDDHEDSPFGFHPAKVSHPGYADNGYKDAANIGVVWDRGPVYAYWFIVQPDLGDTEYDFSSYDRDWCNVPSDFHVLMNIAPQGPRDEGRCLPGSYLPVDTDQYVDFVEAFVERYDGDGVDDLPELANPIRYWQVGNEPNDTALTDFAELQQMTYDAIKEACPEAVVLVGGATGFPDGYVAGFDTRYAPIIQELAGSAIDAFDFHLYGCATGDYRLLDSRTSEDVLDHIRSTLSSNGFSADLPIWITEMGSYSGQPGAGSWGTLPLQTERQQAADYFRRFIYPLSRGVAKVFPAFGLMEGFKMDDGYFDHTGLIYDGTGSNDLGLGVKKLSYFTYKKMTEMLGGADWSLLALQQSGAHGDDVWLFGVTDRFGRTLHIAWWDWFDDLGYSLGDTKDLAIDGLDCRAIRVTEVLPRTLTGQEVVNYRGSFPTSILSVEEGASTVSLGDSPVVIEPLADYADVFVKGNGSGEAVSISTLDDLSLTVTMLVGPEVDCYADYWLAADTPFGWLHFDLPTGLFMPGIEVTFQAPLLNLDEFEVLDIGRLPVGEYVFYFGFDLNSDGELDTDSVVYDSVRVAVEQ